MQSVFAIDKIQIFSILFSLCIFFFIFSLVKNRKIREEYSLLWFAMSGCFLYLSLDRYAIDRLGDLFGVAYKPIVFTLLTTGFIFLLLIHLTAVITRLSEQNNELIQEMGLWQCRGAASEAAILAIVPAYNEEGSIAGVIADLKSSGLDLDVLVVNDGSRDQTSSVAAATGKALVVDLLKNLGIGGAVQAGFKFAARHHYRFAVQFDGDGQHLAGEIGKLLSALEKGGGNLVIGSRFLAKGAGFRSTFSRRIGIRIFQLLNFLLIGRRITDNTSGFRAYDRLAIEFLAQNYPVDYPEPESVILLGRNGFVIAETPVLMRERVEGASSISGLLSIYYMIKVMLACIMAALRKPVA
jgi:hypothetical protein